MRPVVLQVCQTAFYEKWCVLLCLSKQHEVCNAVTLCLHLPPHLATQVTHSADEGHGALASAGSKLPTRVYTCLVRTNRGGGFEQHYLSEP